MRDELKVNNTILLLIEERQLGWFGELSRMHSSRQSHESMDEENHKNLRKRQKQQDIVRGNENGTRQKIKRLEESSAL